VPVALQTMSSARSNLRGAFGRNLAVGNSRLNKKCCIKGSWLSRQGKGAYRGGLVCVKYYTKSTASGTRNKRGPTFFVNRRERVPLGAKIVVASREKGG